MTDHSQPRFQRLGRYNQRANREMFDILSGLTEPARRRDTGAWFGSLHGILNHIIICDINWLKRFLALSPQSPVLNDPVLDPPNLSWTRDLHDDFEALSRHRRQVDGLIIEWFAEFPAQRYAERFTYTDSSGAGKTASAEGAFEFLFLHQIHHRGQISQILDSIGLSNNFADNAAFLEQDG